jgi:hypothetical protein
MRGLKSLHSLIGGVYMMTWVYLIQRRILKRTHVGALKLYRWNSVMNFFLAIQYCCHDRLLSNAPDGAQTP